MTRDYSDYWAHLGNSHASHPGNRFRYEMIARQVQRLSREFGRVIDCGCGDGSLLTRLSREVRCGAMYGIDVARSPVTASVCPDLQFTLQDLGRPLAPCLRGGFDLVLCSEVIEHVPDDQAVIDNLAALARPGGIVVLTTQTGRIYRTEQFLGHLRHYDLRPLAARVEAAGLHVESSFRCGWPWLNLQKIGAHHFQNAVQKHVVQAERLGASTRLAFSLLARLYRISSTHRGPQLFILARKPASPAGSLPRLTGGAAQ